MKRIALAILLCLPPLLSALTVEKGNLKVVADDQTGGYLCYARLSAESSWFPLYVESYTSSYLELSVNGEVLLPGSSRDYSLRFEQDEAGLAVIFEGDDLRVTERITLKEDSRRTAYFSLSLEMENRGSETVEGGIKRVFDTAFVRGNTHFLADGEAIGEETLFEGARIPSLILSLGSRPGEKLYFRTAPRLPDRILIANWNRMDREGWDYAPAEGTNFNALPFSINDSAVGFYWMPEPVKKGESLKAEIDLGPFDFTLDGKREALPAAEGGIIVPSADPGLALLHLEEQLEYLDRLLADLQVLIERGENITQDDILTLQDRMDMLEQKKQDYEKLR